MQTQFCQTATRIEVQRPARQLDAGDSCSRHGVRQDIGQEFTGVGSAEGDSVRDAASGFGEAG